MNSIMSHPYRMISASLGIALSAGLMATPRASAQINPCPQVYYEEPFNSYLPAPAGCPPNEAGGRSPTADAPIPSPTATPTPLPDQEPDPIATVELIDGRIDVRLVNTTRAMINYQIVTDTEVRTLPGQSDVTLQNLITPTTITLDRQDAGLIEVTADSPEPGFLEIILDATTDLGIDTGSVVIDETGSIFAN